MDIKLTCVEALDRSWFQVAAFKWGTREVSSSDETFLAVRQTVYIAFFLIICVPFASECGFEYKACSWFELLHGQGKCNERANLIAWNLQSSVLDICETEVMRRGRVLLYLIRQEIVMLYLKDCAGFLSRSFTALLRRFEPLAIKN